VYARSNISSERGGKKIFWWNPGDGEDTIHYFNDTRQPGDELAVLRFGDGVTPNDVTARDYGNNVVLTVTLASGGGKVTFNGAKQDFRYQPDVVRFTDGTVWTWAEIPRW
jgi:hypothetical protein